MIDRPHVLLEVPILEPELANRVLELVTSPTIRAIFGGIDPRSIPAGSRLVLRITVERFPWLPEESHDSSAIDYRFPGIDDAGPVAE